ncbi:MULTISPECIES: hypothetical protein [Acinetobacter]|uniref:Aminoacyl-transfer RNA synthetases class-II family profile domain-containing protein n=1 Tax=Acinetobacter parvus DSM 16617 = CIP 108168 TaxID=981333 RepID=N8RS99_9GAMM|nr:MULTISPECIES: hypothetical protein [Acinetobacter]ENU36992.1 hypothetical protein F988_00799 [Acinetobacter parvus DSM 16617 = CIP 108168]ENU90251.1 hypothetical protein F972_00399 [Acinetobacter sp. CIP 102529]ENU97108.1 hypothetical protein F970_00151 [Acinetobacter sp. CIP 102082]MCU4394893.1 hypothetical protein [Acinetobacter parvus]
MTIHSLAINRNHELFLDEQLANLKCFKGADEKLLSPMLPQSFILAEKYIKSFPQHAFTVSNSIQVNEKYLLSPTCCYPVFNSLKNTSLNGDTLITHKNYCSRCEDYYQEGERQITFLMREYIFFSEHLENVQNWIERVKEEVTEMICSLGLEVEVEKATDPFFNANDFRQKFQENQNLKSEFIVNGLACGSVNLHLKAFSKSCSITSGEGNDLFSACFGLGYDRIHKQFLLKEDKAA